MPFWKPKYKEQRNDRTRAKERCKRLCSKIILATYPICQYCKSAPSQCAHHVITKGRMPAQLWWYNRQYLIGLCNRCHEKAHSTDIDVQIAFRGALVKWLANKNLDYEQMKLYARASKGRLRQFDFEQIEVELKSTWKAMK